MLGTVFSIEEFSVYDGPGIRTTVFLKGCPLRCSWCHNPEGQHLQPEILRSPNGCLGCLACEHWAEQRDGKLTFTQKSVENCPRHLLRVCGEAWEPEALCEKLLKNAPILQNGGGVTFSGGEPFAQSEFLIACLAGLRGKLHTAIQTCGYCEEETFRKALALADYLLFDLKLADDAAHRRYTGVSNAAILRNFSVLAGSGKDFVVRIPLIPTVTDTEENIAALGELMLENGVSYAELMPYHKMAGGKYKMLLREYEPDFDETVPVRIPEEQLNKMGIRTLVL